MVDETLARIQHAVEQAGTISEDTRRELLGLVKDLRTDIAGLGTAHGDHAQSVAGFTQVSTHEATRAEPNPHLLRLGLDGLAAAARQFEATHPRLTATLNSLHQALTNIGLG